MIVTEAACEVRRRVGPQAWVLLEELVARAGCDERESPAVEVTLASLIESLRLSADVIRSALRRLMRAGIVVRQEQRSPGTNRFATTRYVITGATGLTAVAEGAIARPAEPHGEIPDPARAKRPDSQRPRPTQAGPQLSLLDPDPRPTVHRTDMRTRRNRDA